MCTPSEAKALSIATGRFYAVCSLGRDGLVPGDEPQVDGMILHGYTDGKPIYYKYYGIHAELKAIETETVFGTRYIRQPVESCFSSLHAALDEATGDYVGQQQSESNVSASNAMPPNRFFSNEWVRVGKSPLGGFGVFALKDMAPCTSVLLEQPFLRLRNYNTLRQKYEKLGPVEKAVYDGLHAFSKNQNGELVKRANANCFMFGGGEGIFAIASNFNHACHGKRNTQYHWDPRRRVMVFTTDSHVAEGEELFISYGAGRMLLQERYGFLCSCGSCEGPTGWKLGAFEY
ncbi:hypothetical protein N0V93_001676 [Gnomoniopsis smithogilvyi]|uniref:SET domain-containing protein n=1 Tax=Gnomoniopsis smithogilvyi TaxID=1191159 RepID=A0A9W8Z4E5_9PEZI|nr:hypothetical protein N0V93_001676 [Gnomoniopsis smithogilvyi]